MFILMQNIDMKHLIFSLLLLVFSLQSSAQQNGCNCCQEAYRQFDFWVGDWVVKDSNGTVLGNNTITLIEDSCGLQENWRGAKGSTGTSVSFYDRNTSMWHQSWIDKNGGSIIMNGTFSDGKMIMLTLPQENANGQIIQNKTTWRPWNETGVKHTWEVTADEGKNWRTIFEGYYEPILNK